MKICLSILVLAVAAVLAGCGGGGGGSAKLDTQDVAVVGKEHISKGLFSDVMHQEQLTLKSHGQTFPKPGTANYTAVRNQVLAVLVQNAEFAEQAKKLGVSPSDKDVQAQLDQLKKQYFGGSQAKYLQSVKAQGYTDAEVREQIRIQLTSQNLFDKVTKDAQATKAQIHAYYLSHLSQYVVSQREVQEILVGKNKQALANQIYTQVKNGADFAKLAKKYSQDPGSKNIGGHFTAKKGQDVANFDAAVFAPSAKKGDLLKPVSTPEYGWFVIKILGDVQTTKTPESQVSSTISAQLKQQAQNSEMTKWVNGVSRTYCNGKISYQAGYKPNPDPCASLTTPAPTTT